MSLTAGSRLGPYEIVAPIGEGGMGQVYRGRDTKLKRDVAIKVLPDSVATDPERLARFEREAQALAALSHPNIAAVYAVEDRAIVMELVEGEDLAQIIARTQNPGSKDPGLHSGGLPLSEAMPIARQIASALEAAHAQGIVHRDLKPANIRVTPDGHVKVLDFGLAKALAPAGASATAEQSASAMNSPTLTAAAFAPGHGEPGTQIGVILGTAAYMSPEQARGKSVDKRADIWAFGCVVYEMLTGRRLFAGEDMTEILASVVKEQPDLTHVPSSVQRLLKRCLEKDPKQRLKDIGDAWDLVDTGAAPGAVVVATTARPSSRLPWMIAGVTTIAAAALAWWHFAQPAPQVLSTRFHVEWPGVTAAVDAGSKFASLSHDGRALAIVSQNVLWVRLLDAIDPIRIEHTDGATYPFWSPDDQQIAFFTGGQLKKVSRTGVGMQKICDAPDGRGGTWSPNGTIIFSSSLGQRGISRVSDSGGTVSALTKPGVNAAGTTEVHRYPQFLPDGQHFLYLHITSDKAIAGIYVSSLDGAAPVRVLEGSDSAQYLPSAPGSGDGYLLFRENDALMAQPFDGKRLRLTGGKFPVSEDVGQEANTGHGAFTVSDVGTIAFRGGSTGVELAWKNRAGAVVGRIGDATSLGMFALSLDDRRLAYSLPSATVEDIWLRTLPDGPPSKLTFGTTRPGWSFPLWSPDGTHVAYATVNAAGQPAYEIRRRAADLRGAEETLLRENKTLYPWDWSRDGKSIVYSKGSGTGADLWMLPVEPPRTPVQLTNSPQQQDTYGQISPDGRWLAYASGDPGEMQVYVRPLAPSPAVWVASKDGGSMPRWSHNGQELFYRSTNGQLMVVPIAATAGASAEFRYGSPQPLFGPIPSRGNDDTFTYQPSADGQKFLIAAPAPGSESPITVVLNWVATLRK